MRTSCARSADRALRVAAVAMIGTAGCAQIFGLDDPKLSSAIDGGNDDGARNDGQGVPGDGLHDTYPVSCQGFAMVVGSTHRYKVIATSNAWDTQRLGCQAISSAVYLAIPDDVAELQGIDGLVGSSQYWIGVSDTSNEGTFVTVKNTAQAYLPWAPPNPDNNAAGPGEDCVSVDPNNHMFYDERCANTLPAVCECDP